LDIEEIRKKKLKELKERLNFPDKPIKVTDENFDEVKRKYSMCVIDCWAPWCMPCNLIAPAIEKLAKKYKGKIVFGKLNVDENKLTPMKYNVMGIPTLLIFKNNKLVDRIVGVLPFDLLDLRLKSLLEAE